VTPRRCAHVALGGTACLIGACAFGFLDSRTAYELSIYDSIPWEFWALVVSGYLFFGLGLVSAAQDRRAVLVGANLAGLTCLSSLLSLLPVLRYGAYYTQWDVWIYLGQATRIAESGRVEFSANFYPAIHLLWLSIASAAGQSLYDTGMVLGAPITGFRVALVFVAASRIFKDAKVAAYSAILAAIPDQFIGTYVSPWSYSLTLLLVFVAALAVALDRRTIRSTLLVTTLAVPLVMAHPLAPVFVLVGYAFTAFLPKMVWKLSRNRVAAGRFAANGLPGMILLLAVFYLTWIGILTLVLQGSVLQLVAAFNEAGVVSPSVYGRFLTPSLLTRIFGSAAVLGAYWLGGVALLRRDVLHPRLVSARLTISLVISGVVSALFFQTIVSSILLGDFIQRPLNVIVLFVPFPAGIFLKRLGDTRHVREPESLRSCAACMLPFVLAAAAMYPSPYVALFNYQNTPELVSALDWSAVFLPTGEALAANSHAGRYAYYPLQLGVAGYSRLYHVGNTIPANLNEIASPASGGRYLLIDSETVQVANADLRSWHFPTDRDVATIQTLLNVGRIYDNGEVQVYTF